MRLPPFRGGVAPVGAWRINADSPLAHGLVALHPLSAFVAASMTGASVVAGDPLVAQCVYAGASQYAEIAHGLGQTNIAAASMAMWFRRATTGTNAKLVLYDPSANFKRTGIQVENDGKVYTCADTAAAVNYANVTTAPTAGVWHRAVLVFDGSKSGFSQVALYLDGVARSLTTGGTAPDGTVKLSASHVLRVNVDHNGASSTPRYGAADYAHVCIWNRALSAVEVAYDFAPETRWDLYAPA